MNEKALRDIFEQAAELPPAAQAAFVAQACGPDEALREEVEALLAADREAAGETFWQHSALQNQVQAESSAVGETVGRYRLVELIGRGGMGAVYRAERIDAEYEQCVAVKLIDGLFHSTAVIAHFRAERQILANLEHPNIARLLDGGARADGLPYLVMEYIEGIDPYEYCRLHKLSTADRLRLFRQICSAVHFAHQHMVIHRDLKPANILVTAEGTPKLLDFGIAKVLNRDPLRTGDDLTEPGMLKLTVRYASPEQIRGEPVTTASDVYSLGVILYELLAGHSPYGDKERAPHEMMSAVCEDEPERPSSYAPKLKGDLDNVVLCALRKPPLERYASADSFSEDIRRFLEGRPVQAHGRTALYVAAKFVQRNRVAVVVAALVLCALVGGLVEVTLARARADRRFNDVRQLAHSVMFDYADGIDRLPGSTPVRERMVKDALTYLDSLSKEADTPQLQREIVDAYVHVSDVQGNEYQNNLGDTSGALASAQKAAAAAEKLLRRDTSLPALKSAASAFSTEGSLRYASGDLAGADPAYQESLSLRRHIALKDPGDIKNRIALAANLDELGDLYGGYGFTNLGRTSESIAFYEQAKAVAAALSAEFPDKVEVAKEGYETLLGLSGSENAAGHHEEAAHDLEDALRQIQLVATALPHDTNVKLEQANVESRLGQILLDARDAAGATQHFTHAGALLQTLAEADGKNAMFRRGLSIVEGQLAAALRGAGQPAAALTHNRESLRLALALNHDAPQSAMYRLDVGVTQRKLAEGLLATKDASAALQAATQATAILCQADAANAFAIANCGRAELVSGNAALALHQQKAAEAVLTKAVAAASAQSQKDPGNTIYRSDAARSEAALAAALAFRGDLPGARSAYQHALGNWAVLRNTKYITNEDAHRADAAAQALAHLTR